MRSLFKDLSGRNYLSVISPTMNSASYDEYVEQLNNFVQQNSEQDAEPMSIRLPSEIWISENRLQPLATDEDPYDFAENVYLNQEDWSDKKIKDIMRGRRSDVVCE